MTNPENGARSEPVRGPQSAWIVLIAVLFVAHVLRWILLPFTFAGIIAFMCDPLQDWLRAHTRAPRWAVSVFLFVIIVAAVGVVVALAGPPLFGQLRRIATDLHGSIAKIAHAALGSGTITLLGDEMNADQLATAAVAGLRSALGHTLRVLEIGAVVFASLFGVFLTGVLLIYFLLSGERIRVGLLWLVPPPRRAQAERIWSRLGPALRRYFLGVFGVMIYATVAAYVGLGVFLGVPHAFLLAVLTGMLEMVPVIGPATSAILAGLIAAQHSATAASLIGYAIYAVALRLSIDQLLGPIALGTASRLHPTLIIFCFFAGGVLFGAAGVILAVPAAIVARAILTDVYEGPGGRDRRA